MSISIVPPPGGSTVIQSDSPALTVDKQGNKWVLGFDESQMVAERASSVVNTFTTGEIISALQPVYQSGGLVYKADSSDLIKASAIGIALQAAGAGQSIEVLQYGVLGDAILSYSPADLLFVSGSGSITNVAPTTGYLTRLGRAINLNTILVIIDSPKVL